MITFEIGSKYIKFTLPTGEVHRVESTLALDEKGIMHIGEESEIWRHNTQCSVYTIPSVLSMPEMSDRLMGAIADYARMWFDNREAMFVVPDNTSPGDPLLLSARKAFGVGMQITSAHAELCRQEAYVDDGQIVLVIDMGYGGLTCSLFRRQGNTYAIQAYKRDVMAGGAALERAIIQDMLHITNLSPTPSGTKHMTQSAAWIKKVMWHTDSYSLPVQGSLYTIDQKKYESMVSAACGVNTVQDWMAECSATQATQALLCGGEWPFLGAGIKAYLKQVAPDMQLTFCDNTIIPPQQNTVGVKF